MPTITVSDETYRQIEQRAQLLQCAPEDILDDLLREALASLPPAVPAPIGEPARSHHAAELELSERNLVTFRRLLPELLKEHAGEYVALRHGEIAGFGHDKRALWRQIRERYGSGGILVTQVTATPRQINIPSLIRIKRAQ